MHTRLVSYLRDNRDQILENWLTEVDLPLPDLDSALGGCQGTVPLAFLESAFERVLARIAGEPCNCHGHNGQAVVDRHSAKKGGSCESYGCSVLNGEMHLDDFLNVTCACRIRRVGGRVCIELHLSGLRAFQSVFKDDWAAGEDFNEDERARCNELIHHALSSVFGEEVKNCEHRKERPDCPFAFN